jgi:4-amino-4-deoxy-L-arabinose transferase-like glycosyltransferase
MNPRWKTAFPLVLMGAVIVAALVLRLYNLSIHQHLSGDQGRDYLVVMNWLQDGKWPLLGPLRIAGDYTIGPGYFYTLAPLMALSGFHPAAGAATMGLFGVAGVILSFFWVEALTGNRWAALIPAVAFALSSIAVESERTLWNPTLLPFGTICGAALICFFPRRPVAALAGLVALMALLPQWHTTGLVVSAAMFPFVILLVYTNRHSLKSAPWRAWVLWGAALLIFLGALYIPPVIHDLTHEQKNLPGWLGRTLSRSTSDAAPSGGSAAWRVVFSTFHYAFGRLVEKGWLLTVMVLLVGTSVVAGLCLRRRQTNPSVVFLLLVYTLFFAAGVRAGAGLQEYFVRAAVPVPALLAGWAAGVLWEKNRRWSRAGAGVLAAALVVPVLLDIGNSIGLGRGDFWARGYLPATREITGMVIAESNGKPFSLVTVEPGNFQAHYLYLLRWQGHAALNRDPYVPAVYREDFGDYIFVVVRGAAAGAPIDTADVYTSETPAPVLVEDARLYQFAAGGFADDVDRVVFELIDGTVRLRR